MKNIVFIILDEFADWEATFLSSGLNDENITKSYSTSYASIDRNMKKSMGNLKVLPDLTLKEIDEKLVLIGGRTWRSQTEETNNKIVELVKKFKNNPNKVCRCYL